MIRKLPAACEATTGPLPPGAGLHFADQMYAAMWEDVDLRIFWRDNLCSEKKGTTGHEAGGEAGLNTP